MSDVRSSDVMRRLLEDQLPKYELLGTYLETVIKTLLIRSEINVEHITSRAKAVESALRKVKRKQYMALGEMHDLCGVRIVVQNMSDVESVKELIQSEFRVEEERGHGGASAQVFGYSGFHMVVRLPAQRASLLENEMYENLLAEIQIRTILQHAWAAISHRLDYKAQEQAPEPVRRSLHRVAAVLEAADILLEDYEDSIKQFTVGAAAGPATEADWSGAATEEAIMRCFTDGDWIRIEGAAEAAGWNPASYFSSKRSRLASHKEAVKRLVVAAEECGVASTAKLMEFSKALDAESLSAIAVAASRRGYRPFALGPDVLSFMLIRTVPSEVSMSVVRLQEVFRPELLAAAVRPDAPD